MHCAATLDWRLQTDLLDHEKVETYGHTCSTPLVMARSAILAFCPQLYALLMMIILPSIIYGMVPVSSLRTAYYCVVAAFGFVAAWVLMESVIAIVSTIGLLARAKFHLGFDPSRKWPEVTCVLCALLYWTSTL